MPTPEASVTRAAYSTRTGTTWLQIFQKPGWVANISGGGANEDGTAAALSIDAGLGSVRRLANPINVDDAANKAYVDARIAGADTGAAKWDLITDKPLFIEKFEMIDSNTNVKLITNLDMNLARIQNMSSPINPQEATTKKYVDDKIAVVDDKIDDEVADCLADAKEYADSIKVIAQAPDWTKVIIKPLYLAETDQFQWTKIMFC